MKLRVRINRRTSRVELPGGEPGLTELADHIREEVLPAHGLRAETDFSLSLNGSALLTDSGQTLASCGIVPGDLICVILPESAATATGSLPDQQTGSLRDQQTGSLRDQQTGSLRDQQTGSLPDQQTGSLRDQQTGSLPDQQTGSLPDQQTGSLRDQQTGSLRDQQTGSLRDQQTGSLPDQQTGSLRDQQTGSLPDQQTGSLRDQPLAAGEEGAFDGDSPAAAAGGVPGPGPSVCSWEPMLCSEADPGQAPLSLELLYHSAQTRSPSDALLVAANLLMLETGFVPQGGDLKPAEMPAGWRAVSGAYRLEYSHPLCEGSLVQLVGVCMGPLLLINGILKVNQRTDSVCKLVLDQRSHVSAERSGESAAAAFRDLKELSRVFKTQLVYPLIAAAREAMALPAAFGLSALPPELLLRVFRLLDVRSLLRASSVCRHFHGAAQESSLWRHVFRRDFRDPQPDRARDTDWKELYKRFYRSRRDRLPRPRFLPPFLPNPRGIFNPAPPFPLPPGIIGGEYDQIPHPRYDPIGPLPDHNRRPVNVLGRGRAADVRRGFI